MKKPLILAGQFFSDALMDAFYDALVEQYGEEVIAEAWHDDCSYHFLALCTDDGKMFLEHYQNNEAWSRTEFN